MRNIYIDKSILMDVDIERFLVEAAYQKKAIRLYLRDVWEKEKVEQVDAFSYVCDICYGLDAQETIGNDLRKLHIKPRNVSVVLKSEVEKLREMGCHCSEISATGEYQDLSSYIEHEDYMLRQMNQVYAITALALFLFLTMGVNTAGVVSNIFLMIALGLFLSLLLYTIVNGKKGYRSIVAIYLLNLLS